MTRDGLEGGLVLDDYGLVADKRRPAIPGSAQTVDEVIAEAVRSHPAREALVGRNGRYTYADLDAEITRVAGFLVSLGVRAGDRVAASLPNRPDIVAAFFATMRVGAIWVGINRRLAPPEKTFILQDSGASVLLADFETARSLSARATGNASSLKVVEVGDDGAACAWSNQAADASSLPAPAPPGEVDPFAPAAIAYTSGTTGIPKGAVHSQHNLVLVGAANARLNLWRRDPRQGAVLALTILNAMALGPLLVFQLGGTCICIDRTDAVGLADWIEQEGVQSFSGVPPIVYDLLSNPDVRPEQLRSLTNVGIGGQALPSELGTAYHRKIGGYVCASYGLTEAPAVVTTQTPDGSAAPGSSGRALPHLCVSIRSEAGDELRAGDVGEICVGPTKDGPWAGVYGPFLGYWHRPDATRAALAGGVLHSGDLGYLDASGELFVTGRTSDMIIRGGANVYPAEVERVLTGHPLVAAAVVLGKSDARLGERVVAFVELSSGQAAGRGGKVTPTTVTAESLRAMCATELARYKVPDEIHFVDHFERNAMGKVVKTHLRELLENER
jgi:long-chain acyl-CoA synthetase